MTSFITTLVTYDADGFIQTTNIPVATLQAGRVKVAQAKKSGELVSYSINPAPHQGYEATKEMYELGASLLITILVTILAAYLIPKAIGRGIDVFLR